jgi:hypothetical protein
MVKLGDGYDAHHTFPKAKEFNKYFKDRDIDVNEPCASLVWRKRDTHSGRNSLSDQHLKLWRQFIKDNPNADPDAVIRQRDIIEQQVWGNKGDTPRN